MALQVYSTLTRKKDTFHKKPGETVTMYVCGPTVYKPSHIGHMVGPVIFDTVKRYLTYLGYKVKWVVNITDVDDKLINRAKELNTTVPALAECMTNDYFACLQALNVTGIDQFPRATQHISGMIEVINSLIKKGYAYEVDDGVYFDVSKDDDYGKLSNRDPEQMEAGARLEPNAKKRNPGDFALWKSKPGEPAEVQFASPFQCGRGRPGWHIECTCMAVKELGETLDIHGGGLDLQFPHHENELAQSESWTGKPFARIWMHNGLLKMGKEKMAGSVGNVVNVADALKHMSGDAIRFFVLSTHYRSPIDMGEWEKDEQGQHKRPLPDGMLSSKAAYEGFVRFAERVQRITGKPFASLTSQADGSARGTAPLAFSRHIHRFGNHMDDDFNTGGAIGVLFDIVTELNRQADTARLEDPATNNPQAKAQFVDGATVVKDMADILGLTFTTEAKAPGGGNELVSGLMQLLLDLRNNLRTTAKGAAKDNPVRQALFDQTDLIRQRLGELGVTLEDRPGGTTWRVG
jgi:cysteinyl-tRNA synthetase